MKLASGFRKVSSGSFKPRRNVNLDKLLLAHIWPERVMQVLADVALANCCRRRREVLAKKKLMLPTVVLVLFELLEGQQRTQIMACG